MILALAVSMGACATTANERNSNNYANYLKAYTEVESNKTAARAAALQDSDADYKKMLEACKTDTCIAIVSSNRTMAHAFDALAQVQGNGGNNGPMAPQREQTFGDKLLAWTGVLLPAVTQTYGMYQNGKTQRALSHDNTELQLGVTQAWAGALANESSQPHVYVGGNLGDTYGDNYTGGNRTTTDTTNSGTLVVGNQNRTNSPNVAGNGGTCTGGNGASTGDGGGTGGTGGTGGNCPGGSN